jgi:hypothetical protein
MRKVGGLYFFKAGPIGGSVYLTRDAVAYGNLTLCAIYGLMIGWNGAALIHTVIGA